MKEKGFIAFVSVVFSLICLYYLSFTYYAYKIEKQAFAYAKGDPKKERQYLDSASKNTTNFLFLEYNYEDAKNRSLNLGLDLKGGISVILEVSERDLLLKISENSKNPVFLAALDHADRMQILSGSTDYLKLFFTAFQEQKKKQKSITNLSSQEVFGKKALMDQIGYDIDDKSIETIIRQKIEASIATAYDVIRSRIDGFGVTQPNIQRIERSGRILVELPGVKDVERVKKLLQSTAQLEFYQVYQPQGVYAYFKLLDQRFFPVKKSTNVHSFAVSSKDVVEGIIQKKNLDEKQTLDHSRKGSFFELINMKKALDSGDIALVEEENKEFVDALLNDLKAIELRSVYLRDVKFLWSAKPADADGKKQFTLYAIQTEPDGTSAMSGDVIVDSQKSFDQFNKVTVNMRMNSQGAAEWSRITRKNIDKRIAIVLDNLVYTAPRVNTVISDGRSQISGDFSIQEADDLVNVLNAGKLPTPAKIIQAEIVGPSLGKEAIQSGLNSSLIALGVVLLWMLIYYTTAGFYANLALVFNLLFLFGILVSLGAVLTLPGIAGVVLTLAMAVDANILLYERVKEELHKGKSLRAAIDESYSFKGALSSIIDGQFTTLLTGIILFVFGKGPIQGFATTLIIGIFTSIFSAIWLARWFIEWHFSKAKHVCFFSRCTEYFFKNIQWDFLSKRKYAYVFSSILMVIGLSSLLSRGLNLGVDFLGGRSYVVRFDQTIAPEKVAGLIGKALVENNRPSSPEVKVFGKSNQLKITTKYKATENTTEVDDEIVEKIYHALKPYLSDDLSIQNFKNAKDGQSFGILSSLKVGPTVAKDITKGAFLAVFFSLLGVFIYILIRFRKWQFSLGAVISLLHDALVVLGVFSVFYGFLPFSLEIDQAFIAAILTVIGYSINDTVIVYDRIREYIRENPRRSFRNMTNEAINSTLSRTVNTSLITLFVLLVIFIFGGDTIRGFTFALLIGIGFGTYSSVFVSASLMYDFVKRELKKSGKLYLEKH